MMKQSTICVWLKIVPALLLLCLNGFGQQRPDTAVKQELALEVDRGADRRTMEIPAFNGGGADVADFRRIKSWKPAIGESPVDGIVFKIAREDDVVIAHVSVRLENEKEVLVGTYRLREFETAKTEELTKFGLEPVVLKVVKAKPPLKDPSLPIAPQLENKTKAVEVVSFYQEVLPANSFRLTLRNISDKNIIAFDLFMPSADGNGGDGQRSQGDKHHPVMLPGGTSVLFIGASRGGRMTQAGYVPDVELQRTLIIRTVVFDDGTYEGLVEPAAEMASRRKGLEIQRSRVLHLLREPQKAPGGDALITLEDLKEQAYALAKTADASVTLDLMARFPSLGEKSKDWLLQNVEIGLREGKLELLRYIKEFEDLQKQSGEHISFADWMKQTKATYEKLTTKF